MDWFEQGVWDARAMLRRYAISLYRDPTKADDAVSDAICRALENRAQFEVGTNLNGWLVTILKNAYRSEQKKAWRMTYTDEPHYANHTVAAGDPERILIAREGIEALQRLPSKLRESVVAAAMGHSQKEIADMFDTPVGTTKSRIFRGREAMMKEAA